MKYVLALVLLLLSGCSSFKLGGVAYCPFGQTCSFQMLSAPMPAVPAASAAKEA